MSYRVEDLKFFNMKKVSVYKPNPRYRNGLKVFEIETEMSIEDKIAFIDEIKDGTATYLLNILKKWEAEKDALPKDQYGNPKTVSKKAWIKRNDKRKIIDTEYKVGTYHLFSNYYREMSTTCPTTEYGYSLEYTGEHIVHQWFHDLCYELYSEEKKYFKEHDPFQKKLKKVIDYGRRYSMCFDCKELNDIIWNGLEDVPEESLDRYISAYQKLEQTINHISCKLKFK